MDLRNYEISRMNLGKQWMRKNLGINKWRGSVKDKRETGMEIERSEEYQVQV